jgi:hypothetical protein
MRRAVFALFALLASGCYDAGAGSEEVGAGQLPLHTSGRLDGDEVCNGGEIFFLFDQERGDELAATAYYESDELDGERYRATYRVEGVRSETAVVLDEVEIVESDPLPPALRWCFGRYTLVPGGQGDALTLAGQFESEGCGCSGETRLGFPEPSRDHSSE